MNRGSHDILGVRIAAVDYQTTVEAVIAAASAARPMAVSALAVHGVMTGALDPVHRYRLNQLDLLVPDGQPVRWALRWLHGVRLADRVYGPQLMLVLCERAAAAGMPIFLFGGTNKLLESLCDRLKRQLPGLQIAGARPSRFRRLTPAEQEALVDEIRATGAALTFIGLGCPRQEVCAFELRERLSMPVVAVGAAFTLHAGVLPQAPPALQKAGLEWAYRLMQEPRRLWRRYLLLNPLFLALVALQMTRLHRFDPDAAIPPVETLGYG